MNVETKQVKLSDLKLNPDNPRRIGNKEMERLVKSLQEFPDMLSIREIVVDETMTVLGGNMRLLALKKSGVKECTAKIVSGLSPAQKREFIIKDNSAFGEWDMDLLSSSWGDLPLVEWGVDLPEDWLVEEKTDPADAEPQIDKAEELNKVWRVKPGDLWQIGSHRLLCGDSTKKEDVGRVMGNDKPLLMVTDPPYGVEYDADWRNEAKRPNGKPYGASAIGKVKNDDSADWTEAWKLFTGDVVYVFHAGVKSHEVADSLVSCGFEMRALICWAKNTFAISRGHYHHQHEPCWYAIRKGGTGHWVGDRSQTTLWEIDKPVKSETGHSTQKPLECMARPIRNHDSEFVYDPFLGSGTTLIACENLKRRCFGIEISPDYVAVCLQRFEDAFGIKGVRVD
jgi:DNA modification methylase